jgi:hypothetical protein
VLYGGDEPRRAGLGPGWVVNRSSSCPAREARSVTPWWRAGEPDRGDRERVDAMHHGAEQKAGVRPEHHDAVRLTDTVGAREPGHITPPARTRVPDRRVDLVVEVGVQQWPVGEWRLWAAAGAASGAGDACCHAEQDRARPPLAAFLLRDGRPELTRDHAQARPPRGGCLVGARAPHTLRDLLILVEQSTEPVSPSVARCRACRSLGEWS